MVYKEHYIEIYVNGNLLELESQDSVNLRFQNTIYDPEKISSTQAEYSFEFEIPSTPNNDKIFSYANNLSKLNKFRARFDAEVYGDGTLIFKGTLTLNSFKDNKYQCNLVSVKVYSLEEIFGDAMLTDVPWSIPFEGAGNGDNTINYYNSSSKGVMFPLISYGAFQKSPYYSDDAASDYTSKYDIDKYNRWYVESFPPSLNMLEYVKRAFNWKGYTVGGDVFNNPTLNNIYMSTNLADGQSPDYNIGNPKFGTVDLTASWTTTGEGYSQELSFPYYKVFAHYTDTDNPESLEEYNFKDIEIYDILNGSVSVKSPSYMYQPDEHIIVIPADGFYKIDIDINATLNENSTIEAAQYVIFDQTNSILGERNINLTPSLSEITPLEIQLVRNYDDNIELIKGKHNTKYYNGNPNDETAYQYFPLIGKDITNKTDWLTCYPHEDPYSSDLPTKKGDFHFNTRDNVKETPEEGGRRKWTEYNLGYIYNDGEIMAYDKAVSPAFICGFSSMKGGTVSVMKNGYSWTPTVSERQEAFYPEIGYSRIYRMKGYDQVEEEQTRFNENIYINTPISRIQTTDKTMVANLSCMVYLNKNDILQLFAVHRGYHNTDLESVRYRTMGQVNLKIEAASPKHYDILKAKNYEYYSPSEFPVNLKVTDFLNKEKNIADWLQNVIDAFNFEFIQNGKKVEINFKKKFESLGIGIVDLDNRVNTANATSSMIEYPRSMAVKYKIDTDEHGFYITVPKEHINDEDWKEYGDSGYTVVKLNDDSYVTTESNNDTQFSYTWYDNFNWFAVDSSFKQQEGIDPTVLKLPVISKEEYMIDGYDYSESLKHDGYGLTQRFWFKPILTSTYVYTRTYPTEIVNIYVPKNEYNGLNLSYKTGEISLLTEYFNLTPYLSSNYVTVDAYLSSDEYRMIKNGASIHFDDDIYLPVELTGFDASGNNPTSIKMIKKV